MPHDRIDDNRSDDDPTDELPILLETAFDPAPRVPTTVVGDDDTGEFTIRRPSPSPAQFARAMETEAQQRDLDARAARIASLELEITRLTERRLGFDRDLAAKNATIDELNAAIAGLRKSLDERGAVERRLSVEINDRDAQFSRLLDDLDRQRAATAALAAELEKERGTAQTTAAQLAVLRAEQAKAALAPPPRTESQTLREELATLSDYIANRRQWWDDLTAQAAAHAARIGELERELAHRLTRQQRAEEIAERESTRAISLRAELGAEAHRADVLDHEIRTLRSAGTDHGTKLATLQAALTAAESARAKLELEHAAVIGELAAERTRTADRDAANAAAVGAVEARLAEALAAAQTAALAAPPPPPAPPPLVEIEPEVFAHMEAELENMRAEFAAQRHSLQEQATHLDTAGAEVAELRLQLATARTQLEQARSNGADLERTLLDKDRALAAREERIESLQVELEQKLGALQRLGSMSLPATGADDRLAERLRRADPKTDTPTPALVCLTDGAPRQYALVKKTIVMGRGSQCDIQILTHFVSREHARMTVSHGAVVIEDLGSTNGVFVNAIRIERQQLRQGDLVTIGETQFRFLESMAH